MLLFLSCYLIIFKFVVSINIESVILNVIDINNLYNFEKAVKIQSLKNITSHMILSDCIFTPLPVSSKFLPFRVQQNILIIKKKKPFSILAVILGHDFE